MAPTYSYAVPPISLRNELAKIGVFAPGQQSIAIPGDFFLTLPSLRGMIELMQPPRIAEWIPGTSTNIDQEDWTEECQGIVSDGQSLFAASNNTGQKGVYRLGFDFSLLGTNLLPEDTGSHVGSLAVHAGRIFVPIAAGDTGASAAQPAMVWTIDAATLETVSFEFLPLPNEIANLFFAWCTINPFDGLLYTVDGSHVSSRLDGFDPANGFAHKPKHLELSVDVGGPAGGCISPRGHLYLVTQPASKGQYRIFAFTLLNGHFLGSLPIADNDGEEPEGIALFKIDGQVETQVQVLLLDNDWPSRDDVVLRGFVVPDPSVL